MARRRTTCTTSAGCQPASHRWGEQLAEHPLGLTVAVHPRVATGQPDDDPVQVGNPDPGLGRQPAAGQQ
ncbi:hypothetical protein A7K94_0212410 [Modestobacter sp. VKM Ac-2676]|nr:hypothetical protein A7K94_0212410 [Modestobacter sp. VKM Ac-2676]